MDILGASGSEAFSIFCYCEGSENPFYGVFIQCVVKPLASAMERPPEWPVYHN